MKPKVNVDKTSVRYLAQEVKFLGHGFYRAKGLCSPTVHSRPKEKLKQKLKGWCGHFGFARYEKRPRETDEWIRRRIRQLLWKM